MPGTRRIAGSPAVRQRVMKYALITLVLLTAAVAWWIFRR
jgi:hypothetical protein